MKSKPLPGLEGSFERAGTSFMHYCASIPSIFFNHPSRLIFGISFRYLYKFFRHYILVLFYPLTIYLAVA